MDVEDGLIAATFTAVDFVYMCSQSACRGLLKEGEETSPRVKCVFLFSGCG